MVVKRPATLSLIFRRACAPLLAACLAASCNLTGGEEPTGNELKLLNLDKVMLREQITTVTIAAVVYLNGKPEVAPAEGEAAAPPPAAAAAEETDPTKRPDLLEREVLEALSAYVVGNTRFIVYAAPDEMEEKARGIILKRNANAVPAQQARELAATAGVNAVITATVEAEGKRVNFALYSGDTGRILYSDTLVDWDFHLVPTGAGEAGL
jgi:hypothetical protein